MDTTTGKIGYVANQFWITFPYSDELRQSIYDNIPESERLFERSERKWYVTEHAANAVERFATINRLVILPEATQAFKDISLKGIEQKSVAVDSKLKLVDVKDGMFIFTFAYSEVLKDAIKALPGREWNPDARLWQVPVEQVKAVDLFARLYNFDLSDSAKELCATLAAEAVSYDPTELKGKLFKFQEAGVQAILEHKNFLLGDEMGTGKTIQTIAAAVYGKAFPVLIVCPKKLVLNWRNEWKQWTNMKVHVVGENSYGQSLYKSGSTLTMADVYLVNYEGLSKVSKAAKHFKFVAFDEAHYLKNPNAKRTLLALGASEFAEYVVALTGTPVVNNTKELYTILKVIKVHHKFPHFFHRYVDTKSKGTKVYKGYLTELNMLLNRYCYLRREKKDVLPDLPDKIRQKIYVDMDEEHSKKYKMALDDLAGYLRKHRGKDETQIDKATKNERLVKINYLKQVAAEGKIAQGIDLVESLLEQGEKVVVFAHHKSVIDMLMTTFEQYGAVKIDGSISSAEVVNNNIQQFQNNGKCKVIVCSLTAAGVGITLTASSRVVFFEMGWTPAAMNQAEDRCHRNGAKDIVYAYYLLANDSIDDKIYSIIERKRAIADVVAGATTDIKTDIITDIYEYIKSTI